VARHSYFLILPLIFLVACSERNQTESPTAADDAGVELSVDEPTVFVEQEILAEPLQDQNDEFDEFKENFLNKTWEFNPSYGVYVGYYNLIPTY